MGEEKRSNIKDTFGKEMSFEFVRRAIAELKQILKIPRGPRLEPLTI
jgi:hypothetical protein